MDLHFLDNILECSVCLERLKQDARVLPCQHTFCLDCLKRVANKNPQKPLVCPECRQQTNLFELDTLPKNVFLIRLLDQITQTSSTTQETLTTKSEDENSTPTQTTTKTKQDPEKLNNDSIVPQNIPQQQQQVSIPYAKALYDFQMNPMDDEGCIKFQKGMIIQVTRRVDQNWAEGKIGDCVGIFPLSFVQLNAAATSLMQSYATKWRLPASISPEHTPSTSSSTSSPRAHPVLQPTPVQIQQIRSKSPPNKVGIYVALHNYSPLKPDELELKKGSQYIVSEACHDGWLRGSCAEQSTKKGAFPGNYVIPLAYHQKLLVMQQRSAVLQSQNANINTQQASRHTGAYTNLGLSSIPPELPQRNISNSPPSAQQQQQQTQKTETSTNNITTATSTTNEIKKKESVSEMLLKKLGYKKSNENSASYSMDNPVFEDATVNNQQSSSSLQYNHMRSGSCPSRFVYPPDFKSNITNQNNIEKLQYGSQSQRVKTRHRPSLPINNTQDEMMIGSSMQLQQQKRHSINLSAPPTTSNEFQNAQQLIKAQHRKSSSLDTTLENSSTAASAASQVKTERYRCVTKYPAMSRVELSLNVGDVIILQKKRQNGWYKGELSRTGQVGLFPANFVELIE